MNNLLLSFKARTIAYLSASISKRFGAAVMLSSALVLSACGGGGGADAGAGGVVPGKSSVAVSQQSADTVPSSQAAQSSVRVSSTGNSSVAPAASSKSSSSSAASAVASSKSSQQVVTGSSVKSSAISASSITVVTSSSSKSSSSAVPVSSASSTASSTSAAATLASVEVAPGKVTLAVNATQQLVAVGKQANGSLVNLFGKVTWRISKGSEFATVSASGLLKRTAAGEVEVEAASGGKTGLLKLSVANPNLTIKYDNSTSKWSKVNIHYWTSNTNTTTWPGEAMTMVSDVNGIWTFEINASKLNTDGSINVIFNAGIGGAQTNDSTALVKQSSVFKDGVWTSIAGDTGSTKALVSVIDGTIKNGGTSFTSGTVLTINPDAASAAAFASWTGPSLAYVFSDPSKAEIQLVVPSDVSSLSLQALYAEVVDPYKVARGLFAGQCASCHGPNGSGGLKALDGLHNSTYTLTTLIDKIASMPVLPTKCTGTTAGSCAYDIASMILANKWIPGEVNTAPEGLDSRNLRLLTKQEYLNSINDIFKEANVSFDATALSTVSAEASIRNYNTASFLGLDYDRTLGYQMAATEIAKKIVASKAFLSLANNCGTATKCVTDLGKKMFRRPLTTTEVSRYADLYTSADAGKAVLQGLLISPNFLYRSEMGVLDTTTGLYRLNNYEIATLLSYSFWASTPDDALLAEAAKTTFDINAQVTRLLADAKAERGLRRFAEGWFINNKYGYGAISSPTLAEAFTEETVRFVVETIKADLPFKTILTANYTYANTELAQYYKSSAVAPGVWAKSTFDNADPRSGSGVLGHGSLLASRIIGNTNPSPIKRGTFVRDVLMCQELPPPQAAGLAVGNDPNDSNREANERHTKDPGCQGCHQYIDGIGFGFESFGSDALFRTTETLRTGVVRQINALGEIKSLHSAETKLDPTSIAEPYSTVPELASLIANSGQGAACYSRQFYRYVTGRNEETADEKVIPVYSANVREGGGMKKMLVDLTLNPNFILRRK